MTVKVSVIIPVYNVEQYLAQCLESVLSQTLREIEVVAINDGSPDGSLQILQTYAARDARLRIIDKKNEGVGKARNDGLRAATGEFIAFLDSDDYYPNETVLETLVQAAEIHNVSIAGGRKIRLLADGQIERDAGDAEAYGMTFSASGLMRYGDYQYDYGYTQYLYDRRMLIENGIFFPAYKRFQDPPFFVRAMQAAGSFYAADCESYCYRMVPGAQKYSIDSTLDFLKGLTDNLNFSRQNGLAKLHRLCALRLDREGSFMAIRNLYGEDRLQLLAAYLDAFRVVDPAWLAENGQALPAPFVPEVFQYAVSTAEKYEKLRANGALRALRRIIRK
ncbi:MAG: glycosyltransferase family 2 protein [Clostridia bacterium]|nr:glycosyltransferase family 2 protein [Clostridia bacterium]